MRNLFFTSVAFLFLTLNVSAQTEFNENSLIGFWQTKSSSTHMFFWKDTQGELKVQEVGNEDGGVYDSAIYFTEDNKLRIVSVNPVSKLEDYVESEYYLLNEDTLICRTVAKPGEEEDDFIVYKKIK